MDRDNRWDRVEKRDLMTTAEGSSADTAVWHSLQAAYARDENDEFVKSDRYPRRGRRADAAMEDGDTLIFMNFALTARAEITTRFR